MSDDVEEITKTPAITSVASKTKEKDPKKVAAGKKLAEYNRRAKEALKEKMKREAEKATEPEERETGESQSKALEGGWIPEISFTTAISLVGIGLTAINMFMSYKKDTKVLSRDKSLSEPPCEQIASRLPEPPTTDTPCVSRPQPSKIPVPKMGMY